MTDVSVTEIPMQLAPEMWETVPQDYLPDPIVGVLREAHSTAHASWKATVVGHKKILADPLQTHEMNLQRSAIAAARRQEETLRRLDAAIERGTREVAFIDEAMSTPQDPPAPHIASLIANRMAAMKPQDRSRIMADALEQDDKATLGAALFNGPSWLYGMTTAERSMYLEQYRQARYPAALARRAALERSIDLLKDAGTALLSAHSRLFDKKRLDSAAALARAAEEAMQ